MNPTSAEEIELLQFPFSHYNDKARWVLDYKGLPHRRTHLLPGPHALTTKPLTGQTSTPVLKLEGKAVWPSARIVEELDRRFPDPPLFPADPAERARCEQWIRHLDDEVGPMVRRSLFAVTVEHPAYMAALFGGNRSAWKLTLYRWSFPLVAMVVKQSVGLAGADSIAQADTATARALYEIAEATAATGYLVGSSFTAADLTAAALLAPATDPPGPMCKPHPRPAAVEQWQARWAEHPACQWVARMYSHHRPQSATYPGPGGI